MKIIMVLEIRRVINIEEVLMGKGVIWKAASVDMIKM